MHTVFTAGTLIVACFIDIHHIIDKSQTKRRHRTGKTCGGTVDERNSNVFQRWSLLYVHRNRRFIRDGSPGRPPRPSHSFWALTALVGWVLLYVHRNRRLIRDGSPRRPPRLSHSSWALTNFPTVTHTVYRHMHQRTAGFPITECSLAALWDSFRRRRTYSR